MKILIAEDEEITLIVVEAKLKKDGFEVISVPDGREALKILETCTPDIIITDLLMPYTSGLELISIVKRNHKSKIPILVLSHLKQESTIMEAFLLGADDYITKPFDADDLSLKVKRLLKLKTA